MMLPYLTMGLNHPSIFSVGTFYASCGPVCCPALSQTDLANTLTKLIYIESALHFIIKSLLWWRTAIFGYKLKYIILMCII